MNDRSFQGACGIRISLDSGWILAPQGHRRRVGVLLAAPLSDLRMDIGRGKHRPYDPTPTLIGQPLQMGANLYLIRLTREFAHINPPR